MPNRASRPMSAAPRGLNSESGVLASAAHYREAQTGYVRWLRWGVVAGLFLTLIIPFIIADGSLFPNMFFPFITGKNFTFRILTELLFGLWVLLALREPRYRPRFSWVFTIVLAFVVWVGIALLLGSVNPDKSFWSNFERSEGYITILHLLLYFIVMSSVLTAEKIWTWFFSFSFGASTLMSLYGLLQVLGYIAIDQSGARIDGMLGNADYMAAYLLFGVFFGLLVWYRSRGKSSALRWLIGAGVLFDGVMLFYTETRGTILGLIGGLIIAALYFLFATRHERRFTALRRASWATLGVIIVLIAVFFPLRHEAWVKEVPGVDRLATISLSNGEVTARLKIWHMAIEGFEERPVFGWGEENFDFIFNKFYNPTMYNQEQWFDRAHDAFLDWLTTSGALGSLLFIGLFVSSAWVLWRTERLSAPERAILIGLVAGFACHEIFVFDNIVSYLQFFTVLALAHGISQRDVPRRISFARPLGSQGMAVAAPLAALAVAVCIWYFNVPGIANAEELVQAITTQTPSGEQKPLSQNLAQFENVLNNGHIGTQEATEQLLQFSIAVSQSPNVDPQTAQAFFAAGQQAGLAMMKRRPHDARIELFYGTFLNAFGDYKDANTYLSEALADSPDKQQILFSLAANDISLGNAADALSTLKRAYDLDTSYDDARVQYAAALYAAGQESEADALLQTRFGTTAPYNTDLLQALYQWKQYPRAEDILKARVAAVPSDTQSWVQLAAVYYAAGDKDDAVSTLKTAASKNPSFASEANELISGIQGDAAKASTSE